MLSFETRVAAKMHNRAITITVRLKETVQEQNKSKLIILESVSKREMYERQN